MAFLILGHIINEPNISLYEYGNSEDNEKANEELFLFRIAEHIHPQYFIDIALGRSTYIDESIIKQTKDEYLQSHTITEQYCFTNTLNIWKHNYLFVLKIALLERAQLKRREKIENFFNWMIEETFFNAIATSFAIVYMGHNRKRPLLKKAKSQNIEMLKRNIRAATWDMSYIRYWGKCLKKNIDKEFWILCTQDIALNVIANNLFCYDNEEAVDLKLRKLFIENWASFI